MEDRKAYEKKVEELLEDYGLEIENLQARAASDPDQRERIQNVLDVLVENQKILKAQFHKMKAAESDIWKDLRIGVENALKDVTFNLNTALSTLKSS